MSQSILDFLKNGVLSQPTPGIIHDLLTKQVNGIITPENLQKAITDDVDILKLALENYGVSDFPVRPLFKSFCRCNWREIDWYLTNAQRIYEIINQNRVCGAMLDTKQGNDYLNRTCRRTYLWLYTFVWN